MPEIVTRHPEQVVALLESQGASCGAEAIAATSSTTCPVDRFCTLNGGQLCVLDEPVDPDAVAFETSASAPMLGGIALAFVIVLGLLGSRVR